MFILAINSWDFIFCDLIWLTHLLGGGALKKEVGGKAVWYGGEESNLPKISCFPSLSLNFHTRKNEYNK